MAGTQGQTAHEQLAAVYDRYGGELYRYAAMILADPLEAEDVIQQVFVRLATMESRICDVVRHQGYLRTAVRNECFRVIGRRRPSVNVNVEHILESPEPETLDDGQLGRLERALQALPAEQREIVHLKIYEQMTFVQIAEATGISPNTASSRYRYAMEKLRRLLTPDLVEESPDATQ